jgi:Pyruvate/2-oxoacid:ferredoxin oxidoreductase delta subunit
MALPLFEIKEIIEQAQDIVLAECPCRALENRCDLPRLTCMKLNTAGKVLLEEGKGKGRRISREEAKAIATDSYSRGLMLQLEWCINPFHYDICSCCRCCCVAAQLRFDYGVKGAIQAGPYVPHIATDTCTQCEQCADICPAGAITAASPIRVDTETCVGCGLCQSVCPASAVEMRPDRPYRKRRPPNSVSLVIWWLTAVLLLVPEVLIFKLIYKRLFLKE